MLPTLWIWSYGGFLCEFGWYRTHALDFSHHRFFNFYNIFSGRGEEKYEDEDVDEEKMKVKSIRCSYKT